MRTVPPLALRVDPSDVRSEIMAFDEQLQRAFEAMTDRLRDDIARHARAVVEELSASAAADRHEGARDARQAAERAADERLRAAVAGAERGAMERGREEGRTEGIAEGREQGRGEGRAEGIATGWDEGWQAGFLQGQRQAEQSSAEALGEAVAAARAEVIAAEPAASGRLVDAVRAIGRAESLGEVLNILVARAAEEGSRAAILLPSGSRFSGWRFAGFGPSLDAANGIAFADDEAAGVVREARRTGTLVSSAGAGLAAPAFAELPPGGESLALPLSMGGEVVAVLYADQGMSESANMAWPDRLEILARHAAQRLEGLTALRTACLLTERAEPARVPASPAARPVEGSGDEAAARRYARLLVSEIKLYHEADVIAGRLEGDLATRLGGEIARARALYEQRVPVQVRQATDHFHAELVRTLANGDESLLELTT